MRNTNKKKNRKEQKNNSNKEAERRSNLEEIRTFQFTIVN